MGSVTWEIENKVKEANQGNSTHKGDPPNQLFVPPELRSDISLDYVTGLRPSKGNTTILTVVDRFSKRVHSISKLPSAKNVAGVVLHHVFHLYDPPRTVLFTVLEGFL